MPLIRRERLEGAAVWADCRTVSGERLLMETLRWASELRARAANYAGLQELRIDCGRVQGALVVDRLSGEQFEISAQVAVNCADPDGRRIPQRSSDSMRDPDLPSIAVKVVIDCELSCNDALAVAPPGRAAPIPFLVPQGGSVLAGTAHLPRPHEHSASPPTEAELASFVHQLGPALPGWSVSLRHVTRVHFGCLAARRVADGLRARHATCWSMRAHAAGSRGCCRCTVGA